MSMVKIPRKTTALSGDGDKKQRASSSREKLKEQITARVDRVLRDACLRQAEKEQLTITEMVESALTDWYLKRNDRTELAKITRLALLRLPLPVQEMSVSLAVLIMSRDLPEIGKIMRDLVTKVARDFRVTAEFQKGL